LDPFVRRHSDGTYHTIVAQFIAWREAVRRLFFNCYFSFEVADVQEPLHRES